MGALFSLILGKILTDNVARFIAQKTILTTLFVVVLPVVLNNFVYALLDYAMSTINQNINSANLPSLTLQLTGLAGWFFQNLYLVDALNVVLSAVSVRVFLSHIPFLRL